MGKTITGLLEIAAAIGAQFIPGLNIVAGISIGVTLGATGLATLLQKTPKPTTTEPAAKPSQRHLGCGELVGLPSASSAAGLGRRGRDDLFEADRHGQTYL